MGFQGLLHYKEVKTNNPTAPTKNPKPTFLPPETILLSHNINTLSIFLEQFVLSCALMQKSSTECLKCFLLVINALF